VITAPAGAWPDPLLEIPGIDAAIVAALHARGLGDLAALRAAPNRELLAVPGLGPARLGRIKEYLQEVEHDARI
jgi:NAD-dependent DNA ligase